MMPSKAWRLAINGTKRSLLFILIMAPILLLSLFTDLWPVDDLTWFNLFMISILSIAVIVALIEKVIKNPFQPERIEFDSRLRDLGLEIIAWAKDHNEATFVIGILSLFFLFLPLNSFWLWLCSLGLMTSMSSTFLVFVIVIAILYFPLSILESIYVSIIRPKCVITLSELEKIVNKLYYKTELTREVLENASRARIVEPSKNFTRVSIVLLVVALCLVQMAGYGIGGPSIRDILSFLGIGTGILSFILLLASEHFGKPKTKLQKLIEA